MKYVDEFKNKNVVKKIADKINSIEIAANIMEVCGTHTTAIFRFGLKSLMPKRVNLISGPGCPVCVTSQEDIDKMIACADLKETTITTFGDMMNVPGSNSNLNEKKADGKDVRIVYSPLDALEMAKKSPQKNIIFMGVGFETTTPTVAATLVKAKAEGIKNFSVISSHKIMPPPMRALLEAKETKIEGFICPGHVSTVIGSIPYEKIAEDFKVPCVISGFEPVDIMQSILILLNQIKIKKSSVEIEYKRAVKREGNKKAQEIIYKVFEVTDATWRGIGNIAESGLKIKPEFEEFDAEKKFRIRVAKSKKNSSCICGEILKGNKLPTDCRLFAKSCIPENPVGACMVSSEGTCAAYYKYGRKS